MNDLGRLRVGLLLLVGLFVIHCPLLFLDGALQRDIVLQSYPWLHFQQKCLLDGRLPIWNPYLSCGYPVGGDPQSQAWYPLHLLLSHLPEVSEGTLRLSLFLHYSLSAYFFYLLARSMGRTRMASLLTSLAYSSSGFFLGHGEHYSWIVGQCWLTAMVLFLHRYIKSHEKHQLVLASSALSLIVLGGYPGIAAAAALLLFLYLLLFTKRAMETIAPTLTVIVLALAASSLLLSQLLPLTNDMARSHMSLDFCLMNAFPLQGFLSLIAPMLCQEAPSLGLDFSTSSIAFGFTPLLLFIYGCHKSAAPTQKRFLLLLTVFLLLSLGKWGGLRTVAYYLVPFFDRFRFPALFRGTAILFALLIAAFGFDEWSQRTEEPVHLSIKTCLLVTLIVSLATLTLPLPRTICLNGLFSLSLGGLFIAALRKRTLGPILILLLIDLTVVTNSFYQGVLIGPSYRLEPFEQIKRMTRKKWMPTSFTVQSKESSPIFGGFTNLSLFSHTLRSTAYNPFHSQKLVQFLDGPNKETLLSRGFFSTTKQYELKDGTATITGMDEEKRQLVASASPVGEEVEFPLVEIDSYSTFLCEVQLAKAADRTYDLHLFYERTKKWPENAADHCVMKIREQDERARTAIPTRRLSKLRLYLAQNDGNLRVKSLELWKVSRPRPFTCCAFRPNEMEFEVTLTEKELAILLQTNLPQWHVFIDGKEGQLLSVNNTFIGCLVPKGRHLLRFSYEPPWFNFGLALSLITWVTSLVFIIFRVMKKWRPKPPLSC